MKTTNGWTALLLGSLVVACSSCSHGERVTGPQEPGGGLYSRYNLHYYAMKGSNHASYANFTDCPNHSFLPYNTRLRVDSWRNGFRFTAVETGLQVYFEYKSANMEGLSAQNYIDLILSPTPVSYGALAPEDQEGIKAGKAMPGMTKQGVMVALGYPARNRTPSTDENTWVYWKGRFNIVSVNFDGTGKVVSIGE
jgi:hypothetical protein